MDATRGRWESALGHLDRTLRLNADDLKARNLRSALLRHAGRSGKAARLAEATLELDRLDLWAALERAWSAGPLGTQTGGLSFGDLQTYLDVGLDLAAAGLWADAIAAVEAGLLRNPATGDDWLAHYHLGWYHEQAGQRDEAARQRGLARSAPPGSSFAGRLEEYKGVQTLIPLFRRRGDRLLIAGAGAYERELRRLAAGAPNIEFLGHLPDRELESLYAGALAVLVPSLLFEVSPTVVLESFANGTPVIARDIGALSELVHDSGGGFLYTREDELAAALDRVAGEREALGERGRQAYEETWSAEAHFARYFALIEQLQGARTA